MWKFESTSIPGVFYIVTTLPSGCVITAPDNASNDSNPTIETKRDGYRPQQLWKFVTGSGVNLLIQSYVQSEGLVLDTGNDSNPGQLIKLWSRDDDNDNQKFYMLIN